MFAEELTDDEDDRFKSDDSVGSEIVAGDFGNLRTDCGSQHSLTSYPGGKLDEDERLDAMSDIEYDGLGNSRTRLHLLSDTSKLCLAEELTDDEDDRLKSDDSVLSEIVVGDFGSLRTDCVSKPSLTPFLGGEDEGECRNTGSDIEPDSLGKSRTPVLRSLPEQLCL